MRTALDRGICAKHTSTVEFLRVEGSVQALINILSNDHRNSKLQNQATKILLSINTSCYLWNNYGQLSPVYEYREIVPALVNNLDRVIMVDDEFKIKPILSLLADILAFSDEQRQSFLEMAKATAEKFELANDLSIATIAHRPDH